MENSTSLLLFSIAYLIIFGFLIGITGQGSLSFSTSEIIIMMTVSAIIAVALVVVAASAANFEVLGSGVNAGEFVWRAGIFGLMTLWSSYFVLKLNGMMPDGTPIIVPILFLGPPITALLWGFFATFLKSGGD